MADKKESLKVYVVTDSFKEGGKPFWNPIGLAPRTKNDNGYFVSLANIGHPNQKLVLLDPSVEPPKDGE